MFQSKSLVPERESVVPTHAIAQRLRSAMVVVIKRSATMYTRKPVAVARYTTCSPCSRYTPVVPTSAVKYRGAPLYWQCVVSTSSCSVQSEISGLSVCRQPLLPCRVMPALRPGSPIHDARQLYIFAERSNVRPRMRGWCTVRRKLVADHFDMEIDPVSCQWKRSPTRLAM